MISVAYTSPFIPPEWIAAHHVQPVWLPGLRAAGRTAASTRRGVCSVAETLLADASPLAELDGVVLTTICDQTRYAAAVLEQRGHSRVFLMNVPSTWQSASVRQVYHDELCRLGNFLVRLGGREPSCEYWQLTIGRYEAAREAARRHWPTVTNGCYPEQLAALRHGCVGQASVGQASSLSDRQDATDDRQDAYPTDDRQEACPTVPLALVGGPLLAGDFAFLQLLARAGVRVVLDASEWGERTLPAPMRTGGVASDAVGELVRAYFDTIPDVFRRPNDRLYDWLGVQLATRGVRGVVVWRRLFCDLWHAEVDTMRRWSPVPVLDIDAAEGDEIATPRMLSRVEAFLELLR